MSSEPSHPRMLILFPHPFSDPQSGVQKRFRELIRYFNHRGFIVDLLGVKNFRHPWPAGIQSATPQEARFASTSGIAGIRNLYLYDHSNGLKAAFFRNLIRFRWAENRHLLEKQFTRLPDYAFRGMKKLFDAILRQNTYDYILISYVQWANLIRGNERIAGKTILTIEDCLSRSIADSQSGPIAVEKLLTEEAERVNLFDDVICLSREEMEEFTARAPKPAFHYIPVFMDPAGAMTGTRMPDVEAKRRSRDFGTGLRDTDPHDGIPPFDLLFVGSDHPSNRKGMNWFIEKVYPLLDQELKIVCAGSISDVIPELPNVEKMGFVEDLSGVYQRSRVTINPLLDGTGMKVKVVESMAHGVPVISTGTGLSGFNPEIRESFMIADTPEGFASLIHRLIQDKTLYLDYCNTLNRVFHDHFSTEAVMPRLDRLFAITKNES